MLAFTQSRVRPLSRIKKYPIVDSNHCTSACKAETLAARKTGYKKADVGIGKSVFTLLYQLSYLPIVGKEGLEPPINGSDCDNFFTFNLPKTSHLESNQDLGHLCICESPRSARISTSNIFLYTFPIFHLIFACSDPASDSRFLTPMHLIRTLSLLKVSNIPPYILLYPPILEP